MADDWEHLNWFHQNELPYTLIQLLYRNPTMYLVHGTLFPIFAHGNFILGKIICWGFLIGSGYYACRLFIPNYKHTWRSSLYFTLLPILIAFAPNQHEWNYWPTNMTCIPPIFFMIFFLWGEKRFGGIGWKVLKYFSYYLAANTFESLLPLAILLELSCLMYRENNHDLVDITKKMVAKVVPFTLFYFSIKYYLNSLAPFGFGAEIGFKPHLFWQWIVMFFSHDYYKTRHLTGSVSALCLIYLLCLRLKKLDKRDYYLMLAIFIGSSYYWYILNYSARRALGGQYYFFWGLVLIYISTLIKDWKEHHKMTRTIIVLFFTMTFVHHGYVIAQKSYEKKAIIASAMKAKEIISEREGPLHFDPHFPRQNLRRGWNFIGVRQLNGFLRHYLTEEELKKVKLKDASHVNPVPLPFMYQDPN